MKPLPSLRRMPCQRSLSAKEFALVVWLGAPEEERRVANAIWRPLAAHRLLEGEVRLRPSLPRVGQVVFFFHDISSPAVAGGLNTPLAACARRPSADRFVKQDYKLGPLC